MTNGRPQLEKFNKMYKLLYVLLPVTMVIHFYLLTKHVTKQNIFTKIVDNKMSQSPVNIAAYTYLCGEGGCLFLGQHINVKKINPVNQI